MSMHYHQDEQGFLIRCYHKGRLGVRTWVIAACLATVVFPVEHYIWTHVPPFTQIAEILGLGIGHEENDHESEDK